MRPLTEARLRRAFTDVLALLVTTAGATAIAGCGATTGTDDPGGVGGGGGGTQPVFTTLCAKDISGVSFPDGLKAAPLLDGAVTRSESAFLAPNVSMSNGGVTGEVPPERGDDWKATNGKVTGTLCATASDKAACEKKVSGYRVLPPTREACAASYPGSQYTSMACTVTYILYTRGDEIGVARNVAETKALMGAVDTVTEALYVASQTKLRASCSDSRVADSQYRTTNDGGYDLKLVQGECGQQLYAVDVHVDPAGTLTETGRQALGMTQPCAVAGRRPGGVAVRGPACASATPAGAYFASMASLEAAAVVAFRRIHRDLRAHGAPDALLDRVRVATRDEIRHTRTTRAIARRYGAEPTAPTTTPAGASPSLLEMAIENAREGCVRETFGALVAELQATRAADPQVRAAMRVIAAEETAHAALSWDIGEWLEAQLSPEERALVAKTREDALAELEAELRTALAPSVRAAAGLPDEHEAEILLRAIAPTLLAA